MLWHWFPLHPIRSASARHVRSCPCLGPAKACAISCSSVFRMSAGDPRAIRLREKLSTLARCLHRPARARAWLYLTVHDCCVRPCHFISLAVSSQKKLGQCVAWYSRVELPRSFAADACCTRDRRFRDSGWRGALVTGPGAYLCRKVVVARWHRRPRHSDIQLDGFMLTARVTNAAVTVSP